MSAKINCDNLINQSGQCACGAVKFVTQGKINFSVFCHCKACSRFRSMSPVHLLGVPAENFRIVDGEDKVKIGHGFNKIIQGFCVECGSAVFQCPEGANFRALYPTTFQIGDPDLPSCLLPEKYLPKFHVNYENRLINIDDNLPKYEIWMTGNRLNNDGSPFPTNAIES